MTVKVINPRTPKNATPQRFDCSSCRSTLEFIPKHEHVMRDWRDGDYYIISCPVCGANNTRAA